MHLIVKAVFFFVSILALLWLADLIIDYYFDQRF